VSKVFEVRTAKADTTLFVRENWEQDRIMLQIKRGSTVVDVLLTKEQWKALLALEYELTVKPEERIVAAARAVASQPADEPGEIVDADFLEP
jgi:hypothetical protein